MRFDAKIKYLCKYQYVVYYILNTLWLLIV